MLCYPLSLPSNNTSDTNTSLVPVSCFSLCNPGSLQKLRVRSTTSTAFPICSQRSSHHQWTEGREKVWSPFISGSFNPGVLQRSQLLLRNCWNCPLLLMFCFWTALPICSSCQGWTTPPNLILSTTDARTFSSAKRPVFKAFLFPHTAVTHNTDHNLYSPLPLLFIFAVE